MEIKSITINKPRELVTVEGQMGVRERKVYNTFLGLIERDPEKLDIERGKYYYTTMKDIMKLTNITVYKDLKDILLKKLTDTKLRIDLLNKNIEINEVVQLIGEIKIINKNEVRLFFTPQIIQMVANKNYTKLELDILVKLNSKYSLTMYEIIKRYFNSNTSFYTIPDMSLDTFRELMGIEENKMKNLSDIKRYVLNQIKKDINEKTDFQIDYKLYKENSRSFNYVRFDFSKKETAEEIAKRKQKLKEKKSLKEENSQIKLELELSMSREKKSNSLVKDLEKSIYANKSLADKKADYGTELLQENEELRKQIEELKISLLTK